MGARVTNPCSTRQQFASCLPSASVPCLRPPGVLGEGPFSYPSLSELTAGFEHVAPGPSCQWTPPFHWAIEGSQKKQDAEVHVQNQIVFIPTVWPCCLGVRLTGWPADLESPRGNSRTLSASQEGPEPPTCCPHSLPWCQAHVQLGTWLRVTGHRTAPLLSPRPFSSSPSSPQGSPKHSAVLSLGSSIHTIPLQLLSSPGPHVVQASPLHSTQPLEPHTHDPT